MEDLIEPDQAVGRQPVRAFVAAVFLAVLVCTGAAEVLFAPEPLQLVGQERRDQLAAESDLELWDGSLARAVETDFRLRGRVRRWLAPYWAAAMLKLGDTPNRDVIVGKDSWLFLRERVVLDPEQRLTGHEHLANLYGLVRRSLAANGSELICVPLPRKASTCVERLPDGIDPGLDYDPLVVRALRRRGVTTVDVAPAWIELTPEETYLPFDSHWAFPARLAYVKAIRSQATSLPTNTSPIEIRELDERTYQSSLRFAGVDRGHPANDWFEVVSSPALELLPPGLEQQIDSREIGSEILHVGTSFSALFWVRALLAQELQARVEDASQPGQMPLISLQNTILPRSPDSIPPFVISEFPIHQAPMISRGSGPTIRAVLGMARQSNYLERASEVLDDYLAAPHVGKPRVGQPLLSYGAGSILSSGDGIVGIRFDFDGEEDSRWDFVTSGVDIEIGANRGVRSRAFPIVEGGAPDFHVALRPKNEASFGTSVRAHVVTDADLAKGVRFEGEDHVPGRWTATPNLGIAALDALALTWDEFTSGAVQLIAQGTDANGEPAEARWEFPGARRVRFLIVTLGPFEGGRLERLELVGAGPGARGVVAGQIRAR
ncbi:hypothetical protein Poly30_45140 [Planctomycetes bacterium Poly30]|uniref:AlgX/AlgJ SGNH hydrolase-like domain-containing protein n=1 Tax=Saltatorellus ferox TaxID=2528018 RepID=A0A518EY04_9BACT|nr:hypothetical protein Poly30_45140 [Planctomycetes bacterium Poly30]